MSALARVRAAAALLAQGLPGSAVVAALEIANAHDVTFARVMRLVVRAAVRPALLGAA